MFHSDKDFKSTLNKHIFFNKIDKKKKKFLFKCRTKSRLVVLDENGNIIDSYDKRVKRRNSIIIFTIIVLFVLAFVFIYNDLNFNFIFLH